MCVEASKPDPNVRMQVIGCIMSRTGTASFSKALEILLNGPVYHGGTRIDYGDENHIHRWINIFRNTPINNETDEQFILTELEHQLRGYAAYIDLPPIVLTGELVKLCPNAKVICTVRDREQWWKSLEPVVAKIDYKQRRSEYFLWVILALLPTLRYRTKLSDTMRDGRFGELYFQSGHTQAYPGQYQEHMHYIKRVVPTENLHFFNVSEGWEPLCKIVGCEIPNVPFPRINDSVAFDALVKKQIQRDVIAWAVLEGLIAVNLLFDSGTVNNECRFETLLKDPVPASHTMPPTPSATDDSHQQLLDQMDIYYLQKPFRNSSWKPSTRRNKNTKQIIGETNRREASVLATQNNSGASTPLPATSDGTMTPVAGATGGKPLNMAAATQSLSTLVLERNLQKASNGTSITNGALGLGGLTLGPAVTYTNIESAPSLHPAHQKHYCDITGLPSRYTDPKTKLRYYDKEIFAVVRTLPPGGPDQYLAARGANVVLK